MFKSLLKEIFIILLISVALAFSVNRLRTQGLPLFESAFQNLPQSNPGNTAGPFIIKEISVEEAIRGFKKGRFLFADARSENEFKSGHIKGAVHLPEQQFDGWIGQFMEETDPKTSIVTYCAGYYCPLAKNLAEKLLMAGFENIYYLSDGWGSWNKSQMPVETEQ